MRTAAGARVPELDRADSTARGHGRLLPTLLIPAFVSLLAVSSVNVILTSVSHSLKTGDDGLQLVISGYALVFGVVLVPAGRAGDVLGRGRLFAVGMLVFGLGSLASGLAPSIVMLNLSRIIMGIGSGLLNPQVTGMIQQYYTGQARGRAYGLFGGVIGVSVPSDQCSAEPSSAGSALTGAGGPPSSSTSPSPWPASGRRGGTCPPPPGAGGTAEGARRGRPPRRERAGPGWTSTRWA